MSAARALKWQRVLDRADRRAASLYRLYNAFRVKRESYCGRTDAKHIYQSIHDQILHELCDVMTRASARRNRLYAARAAERKSGNCADAVQAYRAVRFDAFNLLGQAEVKPLPCEDDDSDYQDYCDRYRSDQIGAF